MSPVQLEASLTVKFERALQVRAFCIVGMEIFGQPRKTMTSQNRLKTDNKVRKAPSTAFKAGVSGNPGGRPKKTEEELDLIAACRAKTPEALDVMCNIMHSGEQEKNRLTAAMAIIERAYGKPVQPTDTHVSGGLMVAWLE